MKEFVTAVRIHTSTKPTLGRCLPRVRKAPWLALFLVASVGSIGLISAQSVPSGATKNQQSVVREAAAEYYTLKGRGLSECRCDVEPNFDEMLSLAKPESTKNQLSSLLKQTHFRLTIGPTGATAMSQDADYAPPDDQLASRLQRITLGLNQTVTGFFQMWSQMTFNSPLPDPNSKYEIENLNDGYQLTYQQGTTQATTTMTRTYLITRSIAKDPHFYVDIQPRWLQLKEGYILSGVAAQVGPNPFVTAKEEFKVSYQILDDLELPSILTANLTSPNGIFTMQFAFTHCRVTKSPGAQP